MSVFGGRKGEWHLVKFEDIPEVLRKLRAHNAFVDDNNLGLESEDVTIAANVNLSGYFEYRVYVPRFVLDNAVRQGSRERLGLNAK